MGALVRSVDLRVVRQLAGLPQGRIERLPRLPRALESLLPIRFEQVAAAVCEGYCAIVRAEWGRPKQALTFEVAVGSSGVLAPIVEVALGHNAKSADGGEHPALGAVDLIDALAVPHWLALTAGWQIEVFREHIARVAISPMIAFAAPATADAVSVAEVIAVAVI
jgi:hypothetical protein